MDTSIPKRGNVTSFATFENVLFMATDSEGVYCTSDKGSHWQNVSAGLADPSICTLAIHGDELLAGTATSGVWRRPLAEMLGPLAIKSKIEQPTQLRVYPNPATNSIRVEGEEMNDITISDGMGRTIMSTSRTEREIDVSSLPSGVYWVRVGSAATSFVKE
jgi:hypothetical protein